MPSTLQATAETVARDRKFWALLIGLALAQFIAFWMLCSSQVHKAEVRSAAAHSDPTAVAACGTTASCDSAQPQAVPATLPVSFMR